MSEFKCDICRDSKRVRLQRAMTLSVQDINPNELPQMSEAPYKDFDCPQCVPTVPYRRVRATKVAAAYPAEYFGKFQMPIERSLAARFGEYLLREGLIRFTTTGTADIGRTMNDNVVVTAHLGVVSYEDTKKAGAVAEVAVTTAPPLSKRLRERVRAPVNARQWVPKPAAWAEPDVAITDEFDEPKDALGARFAGLEI